MSTVKSTDFVDYNDPEYQIAINTINLMLSILDIDPVDIEYEIDGIIEDGEFVCYARTKFEFDQGYGDLFSRMSSICTITESPVDDGTSVYQIVVNNL